MKHAVRRLSLIAVPLLALTGCVTVPKSIQGTYADTAPTANPEPGTAVRWGGTLLNTVALTDRTCFEVLGRPLDAAARPKLDEAPTGRFAACQAGFLDPAGFPQGKEITVTGQVAGQVHRQVGQRMLLIPEVNVTAIQWWQPRPPRLYLDDPWMSPWGPGFGPGYYGGYYGAGWGRPWGPHPYYYRHR
jgi:outer membrane lipoprotein